jgi:hypothetical protein
MPSEQSADVKLEIGHVLFIDIVGYSKLLIDQQSELQRQLSEIFRDTDQFRAAKKKGKLIRSVTAQSSAGGADCPDRISQPPGRRDAAADLSKSNRNVSFVRLQRRGR